MAEESQMSQVSEMSGIESSVATGGVGGPEGGQSKTPLIIGVVLLLLIGASIGLYALTGSGQEGSGTDGDEAPDEPDLGGFGGGGGGDYSAPTPTETTATLTTPTTTPMTTPTTTTKPPKIPPHLVMCVAGLHFRNPDRYKDLPCDYFIFDSLLPVEGKLLPTSDEPAWKAFKELQKMSPKTMSCGVSLPGRNIGGLEQALPSVKADAKALVSGGMRALGVLDVRIDLDTKDKIKKSLKAIFKVFEDAAKGYEDLTTMFVGVALPRKLERKYGDTGAFLSDIKKFAEVLIFQTHITPWSSVTSRGKCKIYPASSWIQNTDHQSFARAAGTIKAMKDPVVHVAVSFTMGVTAFAVDTGAVNPTNAKWGDNCVYNSLFSYEDLCYQGAQTSYDAATMTVRASYKTPPAVLSLDTVESATEKLKKAWGVAKKADIGTMLVDVQLDFIEKCTGRKAFDRVKKIADATHAQPSPHPTTPATPSP